MNTDTQTLLGVWLALIILGGAIAAIVAGVVIRFVGADLPTTLGAAGATFLGGTGLGLAARKFLAG